MALLCLLYMGGLFTREAQDAHQYKALNISNYPDYTSPYINHVILTGLVPDTDYEYKIDDDTTRCTPTSAPCLMFKTGLTPGTFPSGGAPFVAAIVGDIGQTVDSEITRDHIIDETTARFTHVIGDLSYADCDNTRWDSSGDFFEPLASQQPLMASPGNHEIEWSDLKCSNPSCRARLRSPEAICSKP
jgi:hypothetical protein